MILKLLESGFNSTISAISKKEKQVYQILFVFLSNCVTT